MILNKCYMYNSCNYLVMKRIEREYYCISQKNKNKIEKNMGQTN